MVGYNTIIINFEETDEYEVIKRVINSCGLRIWEEDDDYIEVDISGCNAKDVGAFLQEIEDNL